MELLNSKQSYLVQYNYNFYHSVYLGCVLFDVIMSEWQGNKDDVPK